MSLQPRVIYRLNVILSKFQQHFPQKQEKKSRHFYATKAILRKKNRARSITLLDFKLYDKAVGSKWYVLHKNRHIDQRNRRKHAEINSCLYAQLIFDKGAKNTEWKMNSVFNKRCWGNQIRTCNRMKLDPYLIPQQKIAQRGLMT